MTIALTVSLDGERRRDLRMSAGDDETITVTVYATDSDTSPLTVTGLTLTPRYPARATFPVGSLFTVSDLGPCRSWYRMTGEIAGETRTICYGIIEVFGGDRWGYPGCSDYGWNWCCGGYPG